MVVVEWVEKLGTAPWILRFVDEKRGLTVDATQFI